VTIVKAHPFVNSVLAISGLDDFLGRAEADRLDP
jgi:hypothetical protein